MGDFDSGLDQTYHAIEVSSRYDCSNEIAIMKSVIDSIAITERLLFKKIWCDSKACAVYSVEMCEGFDVGAQFLDKLDHAFRSAGGGHNGIFVTQGGEEFYIDPYWHEDFD